MAATGTDRAVIPRVGAHTDLHSESGGLRGEHPGRSLNPLIKVRDVAWLEFEKPSLVRAERFARDFGFGIVSRTDDALYLRGALAGTSCVVIRRGPFSRFVGPVFAAAAEADLTRLARATGREVRPLDDVGGGRVLDLRDPSGLPVRVVHGVRELPAMHAQEPLTLNVGPPQAHRRINAVQRPALRPAVVQRVGHVVLETNVFELGLVLGAELPVGTTVTEADLPRYVAGVVAANDISARDVQLSKGQFYESKSYPTFTPLGPRLVLLEPAEIARLSDLQLQLRVNGELRQDRSATDMIVRPPEALSLLARFQQLAAGDVLLTGTPGGTALKAPPAVVEKAGALLPPALKWKIFFRRQSRVAAYLHDGDVISTSIATSDGQIDLGAMRSVVTSSR